MPLVPGGLPELSKPPAGGRTSLTGGRGVPLPESASVQQVRPPPRQADQAAAQMGLPGGSRDPGSAWAPSDEGTAPAEKCPRLLRPPDRRRTDEGHERPAGIRAALEPWGPAVLQGELSVMPSWSGGVFNSHPRKRLQPRSAPVESQGRLHAPWGCSGYKATLGTLSPRC